MKTTKEIQRLCHDEDCPKCGFPETIIVAEVEIIKGNQIKSMKPLWIECSSHKCNWGEKIIEKQKKKKGEKK